jgi:8-oxo-dGTP pyrophosphatase MutT (NUDIX family)
VAPWQIDETSPGVGLLTWDDTDPWWLDPQASAALAEHLEAGFRRGLSRIEAEAAADDATLRRTLHRAGLRPEGRSRGRLLGRDGSRQDSVRLARLADDPEPGSRAGFLAMLNATLAVKRVIAQGLVRDGAGRFLLCQLTYKQEWDLPGGVVDPHESPAHALAREVGEELGHAVTVGELLTVDWLPPYRQWDDALLCVFDLGVHPQLREQAVLQRSEIAAVHWVDVEEARDHVAPYVARLLEQLAAGDHAAYLEDGLPRG